MRKEFNMQPTRITVDEVKERIDRGEPIVFVDCRRQDAWDGAQSKLPGAIRISPDEAEAHFEELPEGRTLVTYCTCPNEESSTKVAIALLDHGFKNVHPLYGGFDAWLKPGHPVEPKNASSTTQAARRV